MPPLVMNQEPTDQRSDRAFATDHPFISMLLLVLGPVVQLGGSTAKSRSRTRCTGPGPWSRSCSRERLRSRSGIPSRSVT